MGLLILLALATNLAKASIDGKCCTPRAEAVKAHSCCDDSPLNPSSKDPCNEHANGCGSPCCLVCIPETSDALVLGFEFHSPETFYAPNPENQFPIPPTPPPIA